MHNQIRDLIVFQIDRNIKNLFKTFLEILEHQRDINKDLEDTLIKSGFEISAKAEENFKNYRREILNKANNTIRELTTLMDMYEKINGDCIKLTNDLTNITEKVKFLINNDKE